MLAVIPTPILMYHSVAVDAPPGFARFVVTPDNFKLQMNFIRDLGLEAISISEYIKRLKIRALSDRVVVLTFDDGFSDFSQSVIPTLSHMKFTATLYVVSGLIGRRSIWLRGEGASLPLLDGRQISEIAMQGIEIGAHTMTHPKLDCLEISEARKEIFRSKLALEDHLGFEVNSFAYPFGFRNRRIKELVKDAGFESACAVRYRTALSTDDVFDLPRHIVRGDMPFSEFQDLVCGRPARLRQCLDISRSWIGNQWRQFRWRVGK